MWKKGSYCGCVLIGVMDFVAMLLSIYVRALQNQAKHSSSTLECNERSQYATMVLAIAIVLLCLAETIAVLLALLGAFTSNDADSVECVGCRKFSAASCICTVVIFFASLALLLVKEGNAESSCNFKSQAYVVFGGIGCILHAVMSIVTYFTSAGATY